MLPRPIRLSLATGGLLLALMTGASGAAPTLRVTNLGQSSAPVEVGQPPLDFTEIGSCAHPFTLANEMACPPGAWPALGRQWGAIEDVAGGDTLRLELSSPVTAVAVGSTSNYEPGLHDPDSNAISNYDVIPESPAVATSDPSVWQVTLPPLDHRAMSTIGYTFSVVTEDESGIHDYPLGIRSPRFGDELAKCGTAYFSTGISQGLCSGAGVPSVRPRRVSISGATYDGRVLRLGVDVPGAGLLTVRVPTVCPNGKGGDCHRKTSIRRRARARGRLRLTRALAPRLGRRNRMTVPVRFETAKGTIVSSLQVSVRVSARG